jgi:hypothetical protein
MIYGENDMQEPDLKQILDENNWAITSIAGLQFYDYDDADELIGRIRPAHGDRVQLVRRPDNRYDHNAVEIWWRDARFMLGHLPRREAAELAPLLDAGANVRGYIWTGGTGEAWTAEIALVHNEIPDGWYTRSVDEAAEELDSWMDTRDQDPEQTVDEIIQRRNATRERRMAILATFIPLMFTNDERDPELPPEPPRSLRGKTIGWWDQIPDGAGLMTKTAWSEAGFNIKRRVKKPFAWIEYSNGRRFVRYDLYASSQVTPKKRPSDRQLAKKLINDEVM